MDSNDLYEIRNQAKRWSDEAKAANLLTANAIPLNLWLVKYMGLDATLFLSAAYEEFVFLRKKNKLYTWNSIALSNRKIKQKTGLGETRQKKAVEVLEKNGVLRVAINNGIPKKRIVYFDFGMFEYLTNRLDGFIRRDIEKTKKEREIFNEKIETIKTAVKEAINAKCANN